MKKVLVALAIILWLVCMLASCDIQMGMVGESTTPTIEISEDGYWVINGEKTEVKAKGEKGEQGKQGEQGIQGEKGDKGDQGEAGRGILKIEIIDGYMWITYTDAPDTPVNVGRATSEETTPEVTTPEEPEEQPFVPSEGLSYTVNGDGETCTITGVGTCTDTDLRIGGSINGYKVTSIGDYAFRYCTSLTSVTIPDSVTRIGDNAFRECTSLTNITIPDSVTSIGGSAFSNCSALTSVTIGDSVTSIGNAAFYWCAALTSVTIGDSVTSIGNYAFYYCTSLTSITIPDSVTSIGSSAFQYCSSLTSVTIPDSVTSIGGEAFYNCTSLTSATFANPNGWWYSNSADATSGTDISAESLAAPATAAEYLKSTYNNYYWYRTE